MPANYNYSARSPEAARIDGSMLAERADDVVAHLRSRALFVTNVAPAQSIEGRIATLRFRRAPSRLSIVAFYRSLATMISAGVSLHRALSVAIGQCGDAGFS